MKMTLKLMMGNKNARGVGPYRFFPRQLIGLRGEPVGSCAVCRENDKIGKQNKRLRDYENDIAVGDGKRKCSECPKRCSPDELLGLRRQVVLKCPVCREKHRLA